MNNDEINKRIGIIQILINGLFLILTGYLFCVQVLDFDDYRERGIAIRTTDSTVLRGDIKDRNGMILATDQYIFEVYAHPTKYTQKHPPKEIAHKLAPILKMPEDELLKKLKSKKINIIAVKKDATREMAQKIRKLNYQAISVETINKRFYPQDKVASHIVGFYSRIADSASGIENIASDKLQKTDKKISYQRRANGEVIFDFKTDVKSLTETQKGEDVTLTIDTSVQYVCEKELENAIKEKKAQRGSIIVMDVKNGEILAYASYPDFNPNRYWKFSQEQMKNWSLTDIYPPGSTFKIITVATAMELGVINENSKIPDSGKVVIDGHKIQNYDYERHPNPGMISLEYLFEHSSNVGSANIALMLDPVKYYAKLKDFGFGQKTGIDLTAESIGLLAEPENWYKSKQASMGYGYGASVTAIQMISAVSAIANGGIWNTPHVIKYSKEELPQHVKSKRVMSEYNAKTLTKILAKSISNGKSVLNLDNYTVAAKTGTSRKNVNSGRDVFASAIGYFPATNPKVAIYVVIDSPRTASNFGSTVASPTWAKVAKEVGVLLNIPSDRRAK